MHARAAEEVGGDAALVLREGAETADGADGALADALLDCLIQHALQASAVNRELRHVVTGVDAARLAPDLLTKAIEVEQLVGADGDGVEAVEQPEGFQLLD